MNEQTKSGSGVLAQSGVVYVLAHSLMPGIVKIGMTSQDVEKRVLAICEAEGVPGQFEIALALACEGPAIIEARVHASMAQYRLQPNKEFFAVPIQFACDTVRRLGMGLLDLAPPPQGDALGEVIRRQRILLGMSQQCVSEKCGLSRGTILEMEKGRSNSTSTLAKVLDVLGLELTLCSANRRAA